MKKITVFTFAAVMAMLAAGCAPKPLDRDQFVALDDAAKAAMTRTYKGFTQEQLIIAAEKTLLHSDKDYRVTSHRGDGFSATRLWSIYAVIAATIGNDSWHIQANGNKITVTAWYSGGQNITPMFGMSPQTGQINTITGDSSSIQGNDRIEYYLSPPLYNLFFDRMDYFLGLRSDWTPCAKVEKTKYNYTVGLENGNDPLCFHAKSQDPTKTKGSGVQARP